LARSRAPERLPKRGFALFEALAEFAKPRQHRGAQGIPPAAGQETRVPFLWFVSLGKQRNERTDLIASFPAIPGRTQKKHRSKDERPLTGAG
jgi:hypothetical protein